jgi:hypothetical protein
MFRRRGILMVTMIMLIPVALVLIFSLVKEILGDTGMSLMTQRRTKAFYVSQAGLATAFHLWAANNFQGKTHANDGVTPIGASDPDQLLLYGLNGYARGSDGWIHWKWRPGDALEQSFTRGEAYESLRFKVYNVAGAQWNVVCEAEVDGITSLQECGCATEPVFDYTLFDNGDTTDFARAEQHTVKGKIHANGNLFLRPWTTPGLPPLVAAQAPATLTIDAASITSARRVVRTHDFLQNPEPNGGGPVRISSTINSLAATAMEGEYDGPGYSGRGNAFDSYHPDWRTTAVSKYNGTLLDSELGSKKREVASRKSLLPNGYYDQKAGLHIDSSTAAAWCSDKSFFNQGVEQPVQVKELDIQAMSAANQLPANGIIYCSVPVRLVNGGILTQKLTVASCATIYTKGDFNGDPDGAGPQSSQTAALITTDRVFNLTSSFDDASSSTYPDPITSPPVRATDAQTFPGDGPNELHIDAAIVDGAPSVDVRAWANEPGNAHYSATEFGALGVKLIPGAPGVTQVAYPKCDNFLENLQQVKIHYRGSWVHQRTGKLANFDNSNLADDPTLTPWMVKAAYLPPQVRSYTQNPDLSDPHREPPLALKACRKLYWRVVR